MKDIKFYLDIIGLKNTKDLDRFLKEEAYEGRNPSKITYTNNLLLDAERRDFTINAFYMNRNEEIIDLYDGQKDIKRK